MTRRLPSRVLKTITVEAVARPVGRRSSAHGPAQPPAHADTRATATTTAPQPPAGQHVPEAVDLAARGYAEGYERGQREGMADAAEQVALAARQAVEAAQADIRTAREAERQRIDAALAEHAALTRRVLEQLQQHVSDATRQIEEQAVVAAFEAVCRIVGDTASDPDAVRAVVTRALRELNGKPALRVRLHPQDLATLQASPDAQAMLQGFPAVSWTADDAVSMGGCMVDTGAGTLDARIEVQLRALGQSWQDAVARARTS